MFYYWPFVLEDSEDATVRVASARNFGSCGVALLWNQFEQRGVAACTVNILQQLFHHARFSGQ